MKPANSVERHAVLFAALAAESRVRILQLLSITGVMSAIQVLNKEDIL